MNRGQGATSRASSLADQIDGTLEDRFLEAAAVRVRGPLEIRQIALDQLAIDGLTGIGPVVIAGCHIGTLRLSDVVVKNGLAIEDCDIVNLEIRGGRRTDFSLLRNELRRFLLHGCGTVFVNNCTVTNLGTISDAQSRIEVSQSSMGSLRLSLDGPSALTEIRIRATTIQDRLDVVGLDGDRFEISDVVATRTLLSRLKFDSVDVKGFSVERDLTLLGLRGRSGPPEVRVAGVIGSATVTTSDNRGAALHFDDTAVRGDLILGGPGEAYLGATCRIFGVLRTDTSPSSPCVRIDAGATVRAVQAPTTPVRSPKQARTAAKELLGNSGVTELGILYESLRGRPVEQDMAYFALRQAEQQQAAGLRRATMWVRGQAFGWGVTFVHPLRTFFIAVLAVASLVFAVNPFESVSPFARTLDAFTSSLGLWFNVGTGMPDGLEGHGWALLAVGCTALGVALITVLTAVAIRRLTRSA